MLDAEDNKIYWWPINNLATGESSEPITIKVATPVDAYLKTSHSDKAKVWAKWLAFPSNPYTDISQGLGINLNGIPGPVGEFEIYVEALEAMDELALERVPISVLAAIKSAAGWTT